MFYLPFAVRTEWRAAARAELLCFVEDLGNDPEGPKRVAVARRLCSSNPSVNF
jgi:hypothetical protein